MGLINFLSFFPASGSLQSCVVDDVDLEAVDRAAVPLIKECSESVEAKVPAELPEKVTRKIQDDALKIHKALGCRHYGRVDFRLNEKNEHYFLEINTLPGMTSTSLLPMAAQAAGLDFPDLADTIIKIAMVDQ